jgi:hypothetical protein
MVKCVALLCLVLTLGSALAFAAHHHANGTDSATCTVCVAAHSATPQAAASLLQAKFTPVFIFRSKPSFAIQRLVAFALSVRPPPAI